MSNVGVPIRLLYEAETMKVTIEMKNGETYRGLLINAEETMNLSLSDVVRTARNGQVSNLQSVYLRGSAIRFIALPELLRNSPIFKKVSQLKKKFADSAAERRKGNGDFGAGSKRKRDG
eukprot:CAMPEP_0178964500 /NCGR_PEP_ID=MMETSP0789-20121207/15712_1 /TAXON_ID=3005 /ORGANISM="Rhizosolenia setigera, Strain CCMP 1694" /LENGTH=118 /DNA_ID=CAMNT_0020649283 /DNA_START=396 /DNA_END=752 /DNA_ORIENTATION=+